MIYFCGSGSERKEGRNFLGTRGDWFKESTIRGNLEMMDKVSKEGSFYILRLSDSRNRLGL